MQNEDERIFEMIPEDTEEYNPQGWTTHQVGETIEIKGRKFKIRKITKKDLVLRPVGW